MALKRTTKSIPLSGGIVEEVDDFLLEPAGMQYSENTRFTKKDQVEKARSYAAGVVTGASNYNVAINGLWSDGDQKVAVIGNNEVCYSPDAGANWTTDTLPHDVMGMERILAVAEQAGGANYSIAPCGIYVDATPDTYAISTWLVAFERINHQSGIITAYRDVVIQCYRHDGTLISEVVESNHHSPHCYELGNGFAGVVYTQSNGYLKSRLCSTTGSISSINNNDNLAIQDYHGYITNSTELFDGQNYGDLRMGWCVDLHERQCTTAAYHSHSNSANTGVFGYKTSSTPAIKYRFMSLGYPQGTSYTVLTDTAGVTHTHILDVYIDDSNTYAYMLYGVFNVTSNHWDVRINQFDFATKTTNHTYTPINDLERIPINGSIRQAPNGKIYWAATFAEGYPNKTMQDTKGLHHVLWYRVTGGDWSSSPPSTEDSGIIRNHRLCSNIACDKDSEAGLVVQQWDNWNPSDQTYTGTDQNVYTITPTAKKPVTSILLSVGAGDHKVVATFDAGQSKAQLFGQDEQSSHKSGNLYYFSNNSPGSGEQYHRWHYGNRIVQTSDDTFYWMDRTAAPASTMPGTPQSDGRAALLAGSSRFSLYHVNSSIPVHSTNLPDGAVLGTSCPTWYDAGSNQLMSAGILDSPEILDVTPYGATNGCSYLAYADLAVASEEAKVYQCVWVHSDAAGRVHRSAPSVPVYVGKLQANRTDTTRIVITVTSPISFQRSKGTMYLETYESWPGGTPQLCDVEDIPVSQLDGSDYVTTTVGVNMNPTGGASTETDITDYRASKTIYTAGNVLAADPWPNFDFVVQSGRRMFAKSIGDPNTIYYSKTFEQNVAPEFSAALTVTLGNQDITAMGTIDDKLLVWTNKSVWVVYGTGPDNTGANGDFFVEQLPFPMGCTDQRSVLTYEQGVAFYSNTTKEYHLITRDLQMISLGENVRDLSAKIIETKAAIVVPADEELRWYVDLGDNGTKYLPAGTLTSPVQPPRPRMENVIYDSDAFGECFLVYNWKYQKWSLRTMSQTISNYIVSGGATVVDNKASVISQSYVFRREDDNNWTTSELMVLETPWIKVNQLQDFGRFYEATFLGKYLSSWDDPVTTDNYEAGDLRVTVFYDYEGEGATTDVYRFRANQDFDPSHGERLQFRVQPRRQKCQAIKFLIEEIPTEKIEVWEPTYTTGRGFILTAVDLHYGAKGGSSRDFGSRRRK